MFGSRHHEISEEEKAHFDEHGYVVIQGFFDDDVIAPLREAYDDRVRETEEADDGKKRGMMIQRPGFATSDVTWTEKQYLADIVDVGRQLMGHNIEFAYDQIIMKPAGNSGSTPWHQDAGYWRGSPTAERAVTCWLALSEVGEHHGCMQFIPGSHRQGIVEHASVAHRSAISGALEAEGIDESKAVKITMQPGDLSFHHSLTLHYTTGNDAGTPRCGLVTHLKPLDPPEE